MTLRVLHTVRQYTPVVGGLEVAVATLVEAISDDVSADVVTLNTDFRTRTRIVGNESGVRRVSWIGHKRFPLPVWLPSPTYDVMHLHGIDGFLEVASRLEWLHRTPLVLSSHGGIFHTRDYLWAKHIYWETLLKARLRHAHVIATSAQDARLLAASGIHSLIVPNPVKSAVPNIAARPARYDFDILVIGRIAAHKGLDYLPPILPKLFNALGSLRLCIAGEDWDGTLPRLRPQFPPNTQFLGYVTEEEKARLFQSSKVVLFPSRYEGFGLTLVEALAAGALVVVNDIEAFREIVNHGDNGYVVPFGDYARAGNAILELLNCAESSSAVRQAAIRSSQRYRPDRIAARVVRIYEHVLNCKVGHQCKSVL